MTPQCEISTSRRYVVKSVSISIRAHIGLFSERANIGGGGGGEENIVAMAMKNFAIKNEKVLIIQMNLLNLKTKIN